MKFEYDSSKSAANLAKHGIDFEAAQELWESRTMTFSTKPGSDEERNMVYGVIGEEHWTAITTNRGDAVRIISVRRSRKEEAERYDQGF